ncbi:MAG TPA: Crp/Fnr family transcriptional regulator [Solirubrobacteraceae bacterium]|nr:Crp/Fnr family transcriptional regulator [Solirubrobacteraceae bacterium]
MSRNNGATAARVRYGQVLSVTAPHPGTSAPLLDLAPALASRLGNDERHVASRLRVPVRTASDGPFDLDAALREASAFAILVVEGIVVCDLGLAGHSGRRLLGSGDILGRAGGGGSELVSQAEPRASGPLRYVALDDRVLGLAQRYPRVIEGLHAQLADQEQRLLAQLLVCQLPRVQDRVLALMWLLAESWGRVTTSGTVLPMRLTHDTIGLLVGARRSTVTLALGQLEGRGALVRRPDDWLIVERPAPGASEIRQDVMPRLTARPAAGCWRAAGLAPPERPDGMDALHSRYAAALRQSRTAIASSERAARHSMELAARIVARRRSVGRGRVHEQDDAGDLLVSLRLRAPER